MFNWYSWTLNLVFLKFNHVFTKVSQEILQRRIIWPLINCNLFLFSCCAGKQNYLKGGLNPNGGKLWGYCPLGPKFFYFIQAHHLEAEDVNEIKGCRNHNTNKTPRDHYHLTTATINMGIFFYPFFFTSLFVRLEKECHSKELYKRSRIICLRSTQEQRRNY